MLRRTRHAPRLGWKHLLWMRLPIRIRGCVSAPFEAYRSELPYTKINSMRGQVNYHAMILALKKLNVKAICAIGSTGTLRPEAIPVGSIVMPDDYAFVLPAAITFWGKLPMATFEPGDSDEGRIHFAPASGTDGDWVQMRRWVQAALAPVLMAQKEKIALCPEQTSTTWPCLLSTTVGNEVEVAYVQTSGPRFETRSEIQVRQTLPPADSRTGPHCT